MDLTIITYRIHIKDKCPIIPDEYDSNFNIVSETVISETNTGKTT